MGTTATRNRALLAWYSEQGRRLPWRGTDDPWALLVSEVMLQQTQVARVAPVYLRFLDRFPTPASLAGADSDALILGWEDLGYYRRAHNLRRAAAVIRDHGWPTTTEGLSSLPGVGPYTAAAVACFAFGRPVAAVDTNLVRVLSRWTGRVLAVGGAREVAAGAIDRARPAAWNQAVMDLGATRCRPRRPDCRSCPVTDWCVDPSIETVVVRQARYRGSVREARAAVLKLLAARGASDEKALAASAELDPAAVARAVLALTAEGVVTSEAGIVSLT